MDSFNGVVTLKQNGDVAVIGMDNPPVNALGHQLRDGLIQALRAIGPETRVVVLHGTARAFSGGADITEFGKPPMGPHLREVIAAVEDLPIPVVAAIQGVALGGGLELALGCHARVAWAGARLGLPEVKLGLLPGAGGTQRLPRLIGVERALAMIAGGNPVSAEEAASLGLVDALLDGAYPEAAVEWAKTGVERRRVRDRTEALQAGPGGPRPGRPGRRTFAESLGRRGPARLRRGGARRRRDGVRRRHGARAPLVHRTGRGR